MVLGRTDGKSVKQLLKKLFHRVSDGAPGALSLFREQARNARCGITPSSERAVREEKTREAGRLSPPGFA